MGRWAAGCRRCCTPALDCSAGWHDCMVRGALARWRAGQHAAPGGRPSAQVPLRRLAAKTHSRSVQLPGSNRRFVFNTEQLAGLPTRIMPLPLLGAAAATSSRKSGLASVAATPNAANPMRRAICDGVQPASGRGPGGQPRGRRRRVGRCLERALHLQGLAAAASRKPHSVLLASARRAVYSSCSAPATG